MIVYHLFFVISKIHMEKIVTQRAAPSSKSEIIIELLDSTQELLKGFSREPPIFNNYDLWK